MADYKDLRYIFPASSIASGTISNSRLNISEFDDNKIVNDISTLGLRVHTQENLNASNTNSASFDVFQDASKITALTNVSRNASEFLSTSSQVADANVKGMWTTEIDNHGDAVGGSPGTPIVDATGTLQLISSSTDTQTFSTGNAAPQTNFGTKSIRTGGWESNNSNYSNKGLFVREVSGQTSDLDFGTGAYTIEMWVKQVDNNYSDNLHQYIYDFADSAGNNRSTMAPYHGTNGSNAYNGSALGTGGSYAWNDFGIGNWRYVAFVRDGSGNVASFLNGTRVISTTGDGSRDIDYTDSDKVAIGMRLGGAGASRLYINNIRISNVARYSPTSSSMTVPTSRLSYFTTTFNASGSFQGSAITASSTNKMGAVITYQDQSGTNALNTDIVLQLSADNGSNFTTATLTALPDFATGIKMAKVNDLSVTAGTQLKYKILFANQSDGSKEARIRGVSLQY